MLSGNAAVFDLCTVTELAQSPLKGMNLAFLGSSVTQGHSAGGISFVEFICKHNGCSYTKEAVSGTTLTDDGRDSYVQRLIHNLNPSVKYDLFICQLSTNDAAKGYPLGAVASSYTFVNGKLEYTNFRH